MGIHLGASEDGETNTEQDPHRQDPLTEGDPWFQESPISANHKLKTLNP